MPSFGSAGGSFAIHHTGVLPGPSSGNTEIGEKPMKPVCRTFHSFLTEYASKYPDRRLLGDKAGWYSAARMLELVEAEADRLRGLGIGAGDCVALRAYRNVPTALRILALQMLGALTVLTAPQQEIPAFLAECPAPIPVCAMLDGERAGIIGPVGRTAEAVDPREPGFVIFTSGSSGRPKAVVLSQYNLVNNLIDSEPLGCYAHDDIALGALPLEHVFGLVLLAGVCVLGYGLYLPESTAVPALLEAIEKERITRMNGVPSLYQAMADRASGYDLRSLRAGFIGGGPCTEAHFLRIEGTLGMTLIPVYGMSECIGIACADYRESAAVRAHGVGRFYSMNTGRLLLEDGSEAAPGQEGEICVTGPARMLGYWGEPLEADVLLHTGDLGWVDGNGILHISGRKKDLIIRNGRNISSRKIEEALLSVPGVEDAAVVGLPDERTGEVPWAMVACPEKVLNRIWPGIRPRLAKNELPVQILRVDVLPRTDSGKPDKQKIREVLLQWKA